MEILRLSPFSDIEKTFTVPTGLTDVDITVTVTDLADFSTDVSTYPGFSSGDTITVTLPGSYDNSYRVEITIPGEGTSLTSLSDETYDLVRPYIDPNTLGTTASEIAECTIFEMVARSMVDTYVNSGFYNRKSVIQTTGQGGDYIPLWNGVNKILKVYENNILAYDSNAEFSSDNLATYSLTPDKTAIQRSEGDIYNRAESAIVYLAASGGDLWQDTGRLSAFPHGYDYILVLDTGYRSIPADVEYATKLLIEDIKCGKLEYYKRYATSYSTDQYRIQFDKSIMDGTGNMLVDKILDKYVTLVTRPGLI